MAAANSSENGVAASTDDDSAGDDSCAIRRDKEANTQDGSLGEAATLLAEIAGAMGCVLKSSIGVSFLVVAEKQLAQGVPALREHDWHELMARLEGAIDALEVEQAVLLADFEGEMTGFGGELVTAAFMPTCAIDRSSLETRPDAQAAPAGLLIDMRCAGGQLLVRRIMESSAIIKVIWGADGDLTSLRHQVLPFALGFKSRAVVDAQLAFSPPAARLGMARALERVPPMLLTGLPPKESIDFDEPHSMNQRALKWPLSPTEARYAVDDLHRLEAILRTQMPPGGRYASALETTEEIVKRIEIDPDGIAWLRSELVWFERKHGLARRAKAVQLVRHIKTLRARHADLGSAVRFVGSLEANLIAELLRDGVIVPDDGSFNEGHGMFDARSYWAQRTQYWEQQQHQHNQQYMQYLQQYQQHYQQQYQQMQQALLAAHRIAPR